MTSSIRPGDPSPSDGAPLPEDRVVLRPGGGGPVRDDEQTVISNRPPLSPGADDAAGGIDLGALRPGELVGHYRILDFVGGGGMGRVFRAQDTQLDRQVALKVLPREQAADAETLLRFRNEARSGARLDHENIARVYHVGEDQGFPYLVFEFVEGTTIRALVEQHGPLSLAEATSYTLQVADALAHAAGQEVVHRDIKPSNLIVTAAGRVKVIDLGLARIQEIDNAGTDLTASGVTLGTFDYISPEQARDPRLVDTRSDIYSLGCAFFYMLSGRPPFPEGTVLQKLLQHQGDKPPDIREFRPELPEEVSRVLEKMLAKDPNHRFQTATELVDQLQWLAERIGLRPTGPGQRIWAVPRKAQVPFFHRHFPWMAPVAALVCIVLVMEALSHLPATTEISTPLLSPPHRTSGAPEQLVSTLPEEPAAPSALTPPASGPSGGARDSESTHPGSELSKRPSLGDNNGLSARRGPANLTASDVAAGTTNGAAANWLNGHATLPVDARGVPIPPEAISGIDVSIDPAVLPAGLTPDDLGWPSPGASAAPPRTSGVLTVGAGDGGPRDHPTLSAACAAARTGDIIELCYSGPRDERPIDLPGAKLTIRAAADCQPTIVFRPDQDDPVEYHRSMFTLAGGELTLLGVAIEMDLPRGLSASRWALWELGDGARLRLQQSVLTIVNPYGHDVAVFRTRPSPTLDPLGPRETFQATTPVDISLADCVIRGQAVTLSTKAMQPVRFSWINGLLGTSEWLLSAIGGDRDPMPGEMIEIKLKHLTARVDKGLCLLDNSRLTPCQLPVSVDCSDSLILVTSSQGTLVEQFGEHPINLEGPWFTWSGDRNGYQGSTIFWRIEDLRADTSARLFDFDQWQDQWPDHEIHSRAGHVDFVVPLDPNQPTDAIRPADFRLSDVPENWARAAASDGTDVGAAIDRLPSVPNGSEPAPWPNIPEGRILPWATPASDPPPPADVGRPTARASRGSAGDTLQRDRTSSPAQSR